MLSNGIIPFIEFISWETITKKIAKKCRFLVLVDEGCFHCTEIFFSINEYKKLSKYTG